MFIFKINLIICLCQYLVKTVYMFVYHRWIFYGLTEKSYDKKKEKTLPCFSFDVKMISYVFLFMYKGIMCCYVTYRTKRINDYRNYLSSIEILVSKTRCLHNKYSKNEVINSGVFVCLMVSDQLRSYRNIRQHNIVDIL